MQPHLALIRHARNTILGLDTLRRASGERFPIRVYYGFPGIPSRRQVAIGGAIKLQHLDDIFPNTPRQFNTLYLGSSRLPAGAVQVATNARRKGARFVWNQDGVAYPAWLPESWTRVNATMRPLLHLADHVFYQSEFCKLAADRFLGVRQGPWEVLYNPVDTDFYRRSAESGVRAVEPRAMRLLLAGSQMHRYRVAAAVHTVAALARRGVEARLEVTGRLGWNPDGERAAREARELVELAGVADRVSFTGTYTQAEAPDVFRRSDILLHTKYNDPCPTVVIEAMACGLPVVYSATGGVPELVGSGAGVGVPAELSWERVVPPDPEQLADATLAVWADLPRLARAARQRAVERFDVQPWLARHRQVFEALAH